MHTQTSHYQQGSPGQPTRTRETGADWSKYQDQPQEGLQHIISNLQRTCRSRTYSSKSPIAYAIKENFRLHIATTRNLHRAATTPTKGFKVMSSSQPQTTQGT